MIFGNIGTLLEVGEEVRTSINQGEVQQKLGFAATMASK